MASLNLNHIYKVYPNGVKAVNDFCMDIEDKEFIVFVGPSGCGKSTTLRMIAGLEEITAGELKIGENVVNDMEPKDRDIAMVFQNYALYPHMTVYDNMAFSLKLRKMPKEEIDRRVKEAANILGITEYLDRKPKAMSGGQRQRVALGRAIVREPKVFLLDEPLSNLDAKLRTTMRAEISKLHRKLQTTFIYVTHDQVEAMTMGNRIVVMKDGFVQQIDSPRNLYRFPCNKFVAGFIGTPQMNFFAGRLKLNKDKVTVTFDNTPVKAEVPVDYFRKVDRSYLDGEKTVVLGLRAEHISADPEKFAFKAKCRVSHFEELGTDCQIYADFNPESETTVAESETRVIAKAAAGEQFASDEIITVSMDLSQLHIFDTETEQTLAPAIPADVTIACKVAKNKLEFAGGTLALPAAASVADGKYSLTIPVGAISFGGALEGVFDREEIINNVRLIHISAGDRILFAVEADKSKVYKQGEAIKFAIDPKKISLTDEAGNKVVCALAEDNRLAGKVAKQSIQVTDENGKKKKDTAFTLLTCGATFECPRAVGLRLVAGGGQNVFNKNLEFVFSPYQVHVAEEGVAARVERVLDYGEEHFAECSVEEVKVYVRVEKDFAATEVKLSLDTDSIAIIETEHQIRLV